MSNHLFFDSKYHFLVGKTHRTPFLSRPGMQNHNLQQVNRGIWPAQQGMKQNVMPPPKKKQLLAVKKYRQRLWRKTNLIQKRKKSNTFPHIGGKNIKPMGKPIEKYRKTRWENPTFPRFSPGPGRRSLSHRRPTRRREDIGTGEDGVARVAGAGDRRDANAQRGGHGEVQCWPNAGHKGLEPTLNSPKLFRFKFFTIKVLQKPPSLHAQEPETIPCPKCSVIRKLATTQTSPPPDQKRFLRAFWRKSGVETWWNYWAGSGRPMNKTEVPISPFR